MLTLLVVVFTLLGLVNSQCTFTIGAFFPGGDFLFNYANQNGFFPSGFNVCFQGILNSTDQYLKLKAGDYSVISTIADNVIGRAMAIDGVRDPDMCVISGGDLGPHQTLSGNPTNGITQLSDLNNKPILVDSPETGAVVVLYKLLHDAGITNNTFVQAGGAARLGHLIAGMYNGEPTYATMNFFPATTTLLPPPLNNVALAKNYFWPYQDVVYGASCAWAQANHDILVTFFEGIAQSYYTFATNPTLAAAFIQASNPTWSASFVSQYYASYFGTNDGPVTSYSFIPHRAAMCKNILTRQAIQGYGLNEFTQWIPMGTDLLDDPWSYVTPTNKPNQLFQNQGGNSQNGNGNKYRGPVYTSALLEAISNVVEELNIPDSFAWEHPTSRCFNLCDLNTMYPGDNGAVQCDARDQGNQNGQ